MSRREFTPRKSFNFRFSVSEMELLDELVLEFRAHATDYRMWGEVNRTDVLRFLMQEKKREIETVARKKLDEELAAKTKGKEKVPAVRKKAVKP
jgi:hypothetical protein